MSQLGVILSSADYLPNIGGVAKGVHDLGRFLTRAGCEVLIVSGGTGRSARGFAWQTIDDLRILRLLSTPWPGGRGSHRAWATARERAYAELAGRCERLVFHWHGPDDDDHKPADASIPRVFSSRISSILRDALDPPRRDGWRRKLADCDWVIGLSPERVSVLTAFDFPLDRATLLPNGIDTDRWQPDSASRAATRAELGVDHDELVLFSPRRITPVSGMLDFAHALRYLDCPAERLRIVLCGADPSRPDDYQGQVYFALRNSPYGDRVIHLGVVPNREMPRYFHAADVLVQPSLQEGSSHALLEGMAVGLPAVAANVGGNPGQIAHERNGLLVESGDPRALAAALARILGDADARAAWGAEGLRRAREEFSWPAVTARTLDVYARAAAVRRSR